ncbi:alpha-glucan family phosphorylase [Polyangium jinanense]|uniref:glycogen phosphorylase n=1 Tax=Polyangium jinanense TaxID=2829994 RepID=A0A9X4ATF2_9BACT|nr:alpha-glucan family phosphorylase [Polyangium jinanense]MDC3953914.1 alpha-glucan family phosphorylase [Polyangium jinanense]MDC3957873.1 alpha-glucan family phosphorylase [Polyangium jinanense]MDC3978959.1 alpha-glucan family phosphorylase [Polyangium jinanense]MDC3982130.1 alpha-glucan family phosphorylase [Polyangium jinanense]
MFTVHRYQIFPTIPPELAPLVTIAQNLWWTWTPAARELYGRVDAELYERVAHNPILLLKLASQRRLDELARDDGYLRALSAVERSLGDYLDRSTWFDRKYGKNAASRGTMAYFSMEFGIHECLPVYSGGLGVLAGDHLKSASDLGLPLVGVGIAFSQGYFRQSLDIEGWQNERYPPNDWHDLPVSPVNDEKGRRVVTSVELPARAGAGRREVKLQAWRAQVGRVPLYLLDADIPENPPEDRALTNTLYGGDRAHRICQEVLLGVGGVRLLSAIGQEPRVCHMNEGHSAFLALERVRQLMGRTGAPFVAASEAAAAGHVFTTHTPVPAGNDAFAHDLALPYLKVLGEGLGLGAEEAMRLGRVEPDRPGSEFSMPVLAIRMADRYNGVSMLHGREARAMWSVLWPGLPVDEVPIGSVTNGVHVPTWLDGELALLYASYLGADFLERAAEPGVWAKIAEIPDEVLWAAHGRRKERLVKQIRARLAAISAQKGRAEDPARIERLLDPKALTIGFARRFATYKRGTLLLRDAARLARILHEPHRPVQLVFSGKAHPQDWGGKELIRDIVRAGMAEPFRGRIVFVEDYDMGVARTLVAGVDVWLNTPRRPLEASGTSGMKAGLNGVLNASILDGWWPEGYAGDNGFSIGRGEEYADTGHGDHVEAQALYRLLEEDIVPLYYERDASGLPRSWIARMKRSITTIGPAFNTTRMVREYAERYYEPALARHRRLTEDGLLAARAACEWKARVRAAWGSVRVDSVAQLGPSRLPSGEPLRVAAEIHLGALSPSDVVVELYYGRPGPNGSLRGAEAAPMRHAADLGGGRHRFEGEIPTDESGEHAFGVRVIPAHESLPDRYAARLVRWH